MVKKTDMKTGAAKAHTAASNLLPVVGSAPGADLTTPLAQASQFNGHIHYSGVAAFLVAAGPAVLLIMYNPGGTYTPADVGAAASHLRFVLGKQEGDPISVGGYAGNIFNQSAIFMISAS